MIVIDWQKVEKNKPELGELVLCYYIGTRYDNSFYDGFRVLYYLKDHYDRRKRGFFDRGYFFDLLEGEYGWPVTHWARLLKPEGDD